MADLSSASTEALLGAIRPKATTPESFAAQYGGIAEAAGKKLNVDPKLLLAQWGLETGWGKSVVPGTFNLGNIKDFSGRGVAATDNMTGSRDKYRAYESPDAFAEDFAGLIGRKYKGAIGAGTDASKFTAGLKGYAEDPNYAAKVQAAYKRLNPGVLAKAADTVLSAVSGSAQAATPSDLSSVSTDDLLAALGSRAQAPAAPPPGASKLKGSAAGGVVMGLRDAVDAGAQLLRRAVPESVGRAVDEFGNYLADAGLPVARSSGVAGVDQIVKGANAEYDASRRLAGRSGIDLARIGGAIANPVNRLVPMAGAAGTGALALRAGAQGALSGAATPVTDTENFGVNKLAQVGLGGAAGAAGGVVADKLIKGASNLANRLKAATTSRAELMQSTEDLLRRAADEQGVDLASIPDSILQKARAQINQAFQRNQTMDARAVLRAAEAESVLGPQAGLTVGQATRDPQQFAREMNLRGVEGAGNALSERFSAQNNRLIQALNERGAAGAPGEFQTGNRLLDALRQYDVSRQANVSGLYNQARALNAGEIPLNHRAFADAALAGLDREMKSGFLPPQIERIVNGVSRGEIPLNISTAEQIKSTLAEATRAANRAGDGNTVRALGIVRDALEGAAPMGDVRFGGNQLVPFGTPLPPSSLGAEAQGAFNAARSAARARFGELEANPALRAAVEGADPDKFFQARVLNAPVREVRALLDTVPEQAGAVRQQVVDYLKRQALGGASDEVGKFSQSGYNRALSKLGNEKLAAIFSPEEVAQLRSIGNVASYIQSQPAGAAVNNSNTAAAVMNLLSQVGGTVGRFPFANIARNSINQFRNENAVANALAGQIPAQAKEAPVNALRALLPPVAGGLGALSGEAGR
ncbi:glucosaminidase domain-containing protein [Cupriavidus taiwanensis]|uniref:glucosaminidase domain-containing protein n=1 Tax=Cupriavidus taiwanensis TaxID=164546 RepID=UPI0015719098|nr:glucosaminidase domain-containing protein [Cupriavidus taiwanensis]NSX16942.1 glucosaminidase domain-containing protein [Cupriavidus taiwanensis]